MSRPNATRPTPRHAVLPRVEGLESRELLASGTFTAPSLSGLIAEANRGVNEGPATIGTMVQALQTQLVQGPLAALETGNVTGATFASQVAALDASFSSSVRSTLSAYPNISAILNLQAAKVNDLTAAVGLQADSNFITGNGTVAAAANAIFSLTDGPLHPLNSPVSAYRSASNTLNTQLTTAGNALGSTSTPRLTLAQLQAIAVADATAYQATVDASLQQNPNAQSKVAVPVAAFEGAVNAITTTDLSVQQTAYTTAVSNLKSALIGSGGLFAPDGQVGRSA